MEKHNILGPPGKAGHLTVWVKDQGAAVVKDEILAEASGDAGSFSIPCSRAGTLSRRIIQPGDAFNDSSIIGEISVCTHPAFFGKLCVSCGVHQSKIDVAGDDKDIFNAASSSPGQILLSGGHQIVLSNQEASVMKGLLTEGLIKQRKLALILDLDNTLIHAQPVRHPPSKLCENMFHIVLKDNRREEHHIVQKRNLLDSFLHEASQLFQLSVYTHGLRKYAEGIVNNIDPEGLYFGHRIVSWSDVPGVKNRESRKYGKKSLKNMFLDDWSMVLVLDDREDVWMTSTQHRHLLQVRPFFYDGFGQFVAAMEVERLRSIRQQEEADAALNEDNVVVIVDDNDSASVRSQDVDQQIDENSEIEVIEKHGGSAWASDNQLKRSLEVLTEIHRRYYERSDQVLNNADSSASSDAIGGKRKFINGVMQRPTTSDILSDMKQTVLAGCVIVFSGIFPVNVRPSEIRNQVLYRQVLALGAVVDLEVSQRTTHLITSNAHTAKAKACIEMKSVFVVHPDWLMYCIWELLRVPETGFAIAPLPSIDPKPFDTTILNVKENSEIEEWDGVKDKKTRICSGGVANGGAIDRINKSAERHLSDGSDDEVWLKNIEDQINDEF